MRICVGDGSGAELEKFVLSIRRHDARGSCAVKLQSLSVGQNPDGLLNGIRVQLITYLNQRRDGAIADLDA